MHSGIFLIISYFLYSVNVIFYYKKAPRTKRTSMLRDSTLSQYACTPCRAEFGTQYIF